MLGGKHNEGDMVAAVAAVVPSDRASRGRARSLAAVLIAAAVLLVPAAPVLADASAMEGASGEKLPATVTWSFSMYEARAVRFQNPDYAACTAASVESMLNLIALSTDEVAPFGIDDQLPTTNLRWRYDNTYATQSAILRWERDHMTMSRGYPGSDPHGWRNALNFYGWGSLTAGVYKDSAYSSFDAAARATVLSLARHKKPVGILGWFGSHAQMVTGYTVKGEDPRVSDNWTIAGVFITDPLQGDNMRNAFVTYNDWKTGRLYFRFSPYWQNEYTTPDPLDGAVGSREWRGKWVIINAVK